mgnify:FL=1|jgi:probable F420-dependent oxidoreductase
MKIGIVAPFGNTPKRDLNFAKEFSQALEELGFSSLWLPEHVMFFSPKDYDSKYPYSEDGSPPFDDDAALYDPLIFIAALSQATTFLRFATSVLVLPQRPALLTAKEVMTLDHVTGGRFDFGVGAGWSSEEYAALGVNFEHRGTRFDEYIMAIKEIWNNPKASFDGKFVQFSNAIIRPEPVTKGGPLFLIGGDSPAAMRRAARYGDGWYGWWSGYELEEHLSKLTKIMALHGRKNDDNFHLRLGIPPQKDYKILNKKIIEARSLHVEELAITVKISSSNFAAELLDLKNSIDL